MSETPDKIVSEHLIAVRGEVDALAAGMREIRTDLNDLKVRVTAVETGLAGAHRRLDGLDHRMDRVERRLDLADA